MSSAYFRKCPKTQENVNYTTQSPAYSLYLPPKRKPASFLRSTELLTLFVLSPEKTLIGNHRPPSSCRHSGSWGHQCNNNRNSTQHCPSNPDRRGRVRRTVQKSSRDGNNLREYTFVMHCRFDEVQTCAHRGFALRVWLHSQARQLEQ